MNRSAPSAGADAGRRKKRTDVDSRVIGIIEDVRKNGDAALRKYTRRFDGANPRSLRTGRAEWEAAFSQVSRALLADMKRAALYLRRFAGRQLRAYKDFEFEIEKGVFVGQRVTPVGRLGIYVPGGRFPLFSSLLMAAVPAGVAGVKDIVVCTPPARDGTIPLAMLAAARLAGVRDVFKVGGAQAIAAMAWGTATVPRVDKIVGPGNAYVNSAKRLLYGQVGVDFMAGPTEILIIAQDGANPAFIASDLIAQAEHDPEADARVVTDSGKLAARIGGALRIQLRDPKTSSIARRLLASRELILRVKGMDEAVELANRMAPEHLEICVKRPEKLIPRLTAFGSLGIGGLASAVLEDYATGLNHILPTNSAAKYTGGLSVRDFLKCQTTLRVSKDGLRRIGPLAQRLAWEEGLPGHVNAVVQRLRAIGAES